VTDVTDVIDVIHLMKSEMIDDTTVIDVTEVIEEIGLGCAQDCGSCECCESDAMCCARDVVR